MSCPAANICNLTHSAANNSKHGEVHRKFTFKLICDTFGFSGFLPGAELLRSLIAFLLPIPPSLPPLQSSCQPLFSVEQPNEQTAAQPANSPPSSLTREKWLTRKFCLWMNHSGKYKYLQGTQNEREGEGKKEIVGGGRRHIKSSAYALCLFTVCALCSACMSPLSGFQHLASLTVMWLSDEFKT